MKARHVRWILVTSAVGALAVVGILALTPHAPIERNAYVPHVPVAAVPLRPANRVHEVPPALSDPACPSSLLIELDGSPRTACIATTRVHDRGNLVTYDIALENPKGRLMIDRTGKRVMAARLELAGARRLSCDQDTCAGGIEISELGKDGGRRIALHEVALLGATAAVVSGTLSMHERAPGEVLCDRPKLTVIESGGRIRDFCPMGGAGFEVAEDGSRKYRFDALSGDTLMLELGADFRLRAAKLSGSDGDAACRGAQCAGVRRQSPSPGIEDAFSFEAVPLTAVDGVATSTLTGRLEIPSAD
jgi:hypothetical protein